jgi:Ankyrin repeats (3 copies)
LLAHADFAANQGSFGNACLLLEKGAKVMAKDKRGRTPLHLASKKNHIKVAWLLVDNGADLSEADPGTYFMHLFCLDKTLEQQKADMAVFVQEQKVAHDELQTTLQQEQEQQKVYMQNLEDRHAKYRCEQEELNKKHEEKLATLQDKLERLLNPDYNKKQQALQEAAAHEKEEQLQALRAENEQLKLVISRLEKQQEQERQKIKMQALQETMARFQAEMASLEQQQTLQVGEETTTATTTTTTN